MKKIIFSIALFLVLIILIFFYFTRSSSSYQPVYFVSDKASFIFESKDPVKAWHTIVNSDIWNHYKTNSFFEDLNGDIESYDSLVRSNKILLNLVGSKSVLVAHVPADKNTYDFLYVLELGKAANINKPAKFIKSLFGEGYQVTFRDYKNTRIVEILDTQAQLFYFLCFAEGNLLFSFNPKIIEDALDASKSITIGKDMKYLDVKSKLDPKSLFDLILIHKNLLQLFSGLTPDTKELINATSTQLIYSGISFSLSDDNIISVNGYSSVNDTLQNSYLTALENSNNELLSIDIIPKRIASFVKINFDNPQDYLNQIMKLQGEEDFQTYKENLSSLEKKLKCNFDDLLFSWMDHEIILMQSQPSNLGRNNEFAVLIHTSDSADAADNLNKLWTQIKKHSPVKIKKVDYKGYQIYYVAFPGIVKALFGKALNKIEKPYFCVIQNQVVLSNHPQTIKNIIEDYLSENTLKNDRNFYAFEKKFENSSAGFAHLAPPVLFNNLKAFVDAKTWIQLNENKDYITCLRQIGFQVKKSNGLLHLIFKAEYKLDKAAWKAPLYNTYDIISQFNTVVDDSIIEDSQTLASDTIPIIIISDLDAKKFEELYESGSLKLEVELKDGLKHGKFKMYYESGKIKIKGEFENDLPEGKWKYYNESGELVKTDKY